ncbi:MAG: hypothetical protein WCG85_11825 [Polyangia bacterium]
MILFRITLPWLVPLLACGVVGAYALRRLQRLLASRTAVEPAPISITVFVPLAILFGLRIITLLLQILGALRIGFRASLILAVVLSIAAGVRLVRTWQKRSTGPREMTVVHRESLTGVEAAAAAFALAVFFCALHSEPAGFDVFTHWWVVPHEILSFDRMAYFYGPTRSVAPSYPLHQVVLGAITSLLSGGRDGIANAYSGFFLLFAALAAVEASWLLSRSRLLAGVALLAIFAFSGTQEVVFGYFYGDALVITGIAFAFLGLAYLTTHRRRSSAVVVWACLSVPLMSKGLGMYFALLGGGFFTLAYLLLGRRKDQPAPLGWRAVLILTAAFLVEIVLPRLFLIGLTSNDYPPPPLSTTLSAPLKTILTSLWANLTATQPIYILAAMLLLTPALALARPRFLRRTSQKWALAFTWVYALAVLCLFLAATLYLPGAKAASWSRYATIASPAIAIMAVVGLTHLGRLKVVLSIPFMAVAIVALLTADYHGYFVRHSNWLKGEWAHVPEFHPDYVANESLYKNIKKQVDGVHGRVFYALQDADLLRPYVVGVYFAMTGIRAPLLTGLQTCPPKSNGLAGQMDAWILNRGAKGPPPPFVNPATDFVFFGRPIVLSGRTYQDLVKVDSLLGH